MKVKKAGTAGALPPSAKFKGGEGALLEPGGGGGGGGLVDLLPHEVLLRCLSYLSPPELLCCQRVSQVMREVARDRSLWRELLASFLRSSPFVCVATGGGGGGAGGDDGCAAVVGLQPHDDQWQSTYFRLARLVDLKGHVNPPPSGMHTQRGPNGLLLPSCPFCAVAMQLPDDAHALAETQSSRKTLVCCAGCDLFVWINGCEHCGQPTAHLVKCFLCSVEVCARCFGAAGKRCEQCGVNGCRDCVRPKATFAETNQRPGAGPRKKKKKKKRRNTINGGDEDVAPMRAPTPTTAAVGHSSSYDHQHHQPATKSVHMCTYCGVMCANCKRVFESEDTDFCVACESSVCYSCDCPCGALDMFQQMRI